jgi:hypothetical protein
MDKIVPARSRTDNLAADGFERTQKLVVGTNHSQPQGRARALVSTLRKLRRRPCSRQALADELIEGEYRLPVAVYDSGKDADAAGTAHIRQGRQDPQRTSRQVRVDYRTKSFSCSVCAAEAYFCLI